MPNSSSGIDLLAALTDRSAAEMRSDRRALGRGLFALGDIAVSLLRGYVSEDPPVRRAAEERWAELNALLPPPEPARPVRFALDPVERERLHSALTRVVATLQDIERETIGSSDPPPRTKA